MNVKFVIQKCLAKLNVPDFTGKVEPYLSDREKLLGQALLFALNSTYREIISEYLPFVTDENVSFTRGKLSASALSKQILYPISVKKGEENLKFSTDAENIYADVDGLAVLRYAYLPVAELTMTSDIKLTCASDDLFSDGTLAQYYLAAGAYDLAKSYDGEYRKKLWKLRYKNKALQLKERRWDK